MKNALSYGMDPALARLNSTTLDLYGVQIPRADVTDSDVKEGDDIEIDRRYSRVG